VGSIFWLGLQPGEPPRRAEAVDGRAAATYARLFHALLARGVAMAPSAFEVAFLSLAHRDEDVDRFAAALGGALAEAGT
jgi:glutamate-1-semialdehyde 2,1-aminomutase